MFTGIVEAAVQIAGLERRGQGARLWLPAPAPDWNVALGDSVSVSGCCLTVAELGAPGAAPTAGLGPPMAFDLSAETLERTWFGQLEPSRRVNLERAMRMGDRLGGHLVSGHVDGLARIVAIEDVGDGGREVEVEVDPGLERYLIEKGSVSLDGVSLTVVRPVGRRFRVALIPVTLDVTAFGGAAVGQRMNVEADLVGKWIEKLFPER